ncbi:hypothetical protein H4R34_005015 [Dimargaris verticillata]|uniref:Uncharacterized protein n=1 Tax=Dimargaris verticillata TaxID=2761393 RepID=A0A9W8AZ05_9FUNG|nr:hypothetical protein H4R34_005015 [Dimargaris verticillata]
MQLPTASIKTLGLVALAVASVTGILAQPTKCSSNPSPSNPPTDGAMQVTLDQLKASMLKAAKTDCSTATKHKEECRTLDQALKPLNDAFTKYGLTTRGQVAAVLSILDFESEGFQFSTNLMNKGQGTFAQLMYPHIKTYAQSIPELKAKLDEIAQTDSTLESDESMDAVLKLVIVDDYSFASAAWFLAKSPECPKDTMKTLESETEDAYKMYLEKCIQTTVTDERITGWKHTMAGL